MISKGLIKYSMAGLISLPLLTGVNLSMAAESLEIPQALGLTDSWTAEDYRNAQSMPLPEVSTEGIAVDRLVPTEVDGEQAGSDYSLPTTDIDPDLNNRLFEGNANHGVGDGSSLDAASPSAVGTAGAYYTSGRINPRSAATAYPWRTNGKLFFKIGTASYICSAAVIAPRIVITAGHCVHQGNGSSSGWHNSVRFVPAYDNGAAPYSTWYPTRMIVSSEWYYGGGGVPNSDDYAILVMGDRYINGAVRKIGHVTGWLGWLTNSLHPNHITSIGYPGNLDSAQIMHHVNAESWKYYSPNNYSIGSDMRGGSSGGAWVQNFGITAAGQPAAGGSKGYFNRVLGVTSWGYKYTSAPKEQGASQLDGTFVNMWNLACGTAGNC